MLRLGSVVEFGFGPNTGGISLMYSYLLDKYNVGFAYNILVNHVGDDLEEQAIRMQKKQVGINVRHILPSGFSDLDPKEKNSIFSEIIYEALIRLAKNDHLVDLEKLKSVKREIIECDYCVIVPYKKYLSAKNSKLSASIFIQPSVSQFDFFLSVEEAEKELCKKLIYSGLTTNFYFDDLFFNGRWKNKDHFIVSGKRSEIEIHLLIDNCELQYVNKNKDMSKAPVFELFKAEANKKDALRDYLHSLNPGIAAIIMQSLN
jgi:hypothetical protein